MQSLFNYKSGKNSYFAITYLKIFSKISISNKTRCFCNINYEKSISDILSQPQNKFEQLGSVHASQILPVILKLNDFKDFVTKKDISILNDMVYHVIKTEIRPSTSIIQSYWNLVSSCKSLIPMSKEQVVLYLKMCFNAKHPVIVQDFIRILETNEVLFDQEIAELLFKVCSQNGNIDEASSLLIKMKENNLMINEDIFSALILVQGKHRNYKAVNETLKSMSGSKLQCTAITKYAIINALIGCEKWDELRFNIDQLKYSTDKLTSEQYCNILTTLAESSCSKECNSILDYCITSRMSLAGDVDLRPMILKLVHRHLATEAFHILLIWHKNVMSNNTLNFSYVFIKELVRAKLDAKLVMDLCDKLNDTKYMVKSIVNSDAITEALGVSLREHRQELAWKILRTLKAKNGTIREHYFWPLLAYVHPSDDASAKVLRGISGMVDLGFIPQSTTLIDYVLPKLPLENPDLVLQSLANSGVSKSQAIDSLLLVLIKQKLIFQIKNLVSSSDLRINVTFLINELCHLYETHPDDCIDILELLSSENHNAGGAQFATSNFLTKMFSKSAIKSDYSKSVELIQRVASHNLKIPKECSETILNRVSLPMAKNLTAFISPIVDEILKEDEENSCIPPPDKMKLNELEHHLTELKAKNMNTRGVLRRLLLAYSASNNKPKMELTMKELLQDEKEVSAGMQSSILNNRILQKDVEGAMESYLILSFNEKFTVDTFKVVDLCQLLVDENRFEDAKHIVLDYADRCPSSYVHNKKAIVRNCLKLLTSCATKLDYLKTKEMFEVLMKGNMVEPNIVILGPLIKAKILKEDLSGAVDETEDILKKYSVLPMKVELMVNLLKKLYSAKNINDTQQIQHTMDLINRIMNLTVQNKGRQQAKEDLLAASVEAGNIDEAAKVYQSVKGDVRSTRIRALCNSYVKKERIEPLEILLEISKNTRCIDRIYICHCLVNIYTIQRNGTAALNFYLRLQNDIKTPFDIKTKLYDLLSSTKTEIPSELKSY